MKALFIIICPFLLLMSYKDEEEFNINDQAPLQEYKMQNIDGKLYSILSLKGEKGLIIIFSCNNCPFVVGNKNFEGWENQYNELHDLALEKGLNLVLVNSNHAKRSDEDSYERMKIHAQEQNYKMPYLTDENAYLANAFGAKTTPHVFLLDHTFKLKYKGSIDNLWDSKREETISYLKNAIKSLHDNKPLTVNTTEPRGCSIKRK